MKTASVTPPNSLLLIMDVDSRNIPEGMGHGLVSATDSCIAIGCRSENDGPTQVCLGRADEMPLQGELVFNGKLSTASRRLVVCTILNEEILSATVSGSSAQVKVFANDLTEPDRIYVQLIQ